MAFRAAVTALCDSVLAQDASYGTVAGTAKELASFFLLCVAEAQCRAQAEEQARKADEAAAKRAADEIRAQEIAMQKAARKESSAQDKARRVEEAAARRAAELEAKAATKAASEAAAASRAAAKAAAEAEARATSKAEAEAKAKADATGRAKTKAAEEEREAIARSEALLSAAEAAARATLFAHAPATSSAAKITNQRLRRASLRRSSLFGGDASNKAKQPPPEEMETFALGLQEATALADGEAESAEERGRRRLALRQAEEERRRTAAALDFERFKRMLPPPAREVIEEEDWSAFQGWMRRQPFYSDALDLEDVMESYVEWSASDEYSAAIDRRRLDWLERLDAGEWADEADFVQLSDGTKRLGAWLQARGWALAPPRVVQRTQPTALAAANGVSVEESPAKWALTMGAADGDAADAAVADAGTSPSAEPDGTPQPHDLLLALRSGKQPKSGRSYS